MAAAGGTSLCILPRDFGLNFFGSRGLTRRSKERGYNYFLDSYIHDVSLEKVNDNRIVITCNCYRSMWKSLSARKINLEIASKDRKIIDGRCSCRAGLSGTCSHVLGLCYTLIHYQQLGLKEVPARLSCTSLPQQWHKPRGAKIKPRSVVNMILAKAKAQSIRKRRPVVTKPTKQRLLAPGKDEIKILKNSLKGSALEYLLQDDEPLVTTVFGDVQAGSSLIYQAAVYKEPKSAGNMKCGDVKFPQKVKFTLPQAQSALSSIYPLSLEEAVKLEQATVQQSDCQLWYKERKKRITASQFALVVKRKRDINDKFLHNIFGTNSFNSPQTTYGKNHEGEAKGEYASRNTNVHIHDCGLVVNPCFSFLGASPDGKVCEKEVTGILEVKCPYSARNMTLKEATETLPDFFLEQVNGKLKLKRIHNHYFQVQGQLLVTGAPFCDFVVYTSKDIFVERINQDKSFCQELLDKLSEFYQKFALPYLQKT